MTFLSLTVLVSACSSTPVETGSGAEPDTTATTSPVAVATTSPTPLVIPTADADATPAPTATATPAPVPTATTATTPTAQPTAVPTTLPTATPTAAPTPTAMPTAGPTAVPTATPRPVTPTATAIPPTPTPTSVWVNPDCYVGPGAADEPVWWCGGKICVVGAPHYGCPTGPPVRPYVSISCTVSDRDILVNEIITLRAEQNPANVSVRYAFNHGDGTIDNTSVSQAYYAAPGVYQVTLLWQYSGGKGSTSCGTVRVSTSHSPTPTPTPTATPSVLQIGCSISPRRTVQVNETLTFTAFQSPANIPVQFVFDHGDGTLDPTSQSFAYYAAPGWYDVHLNWSTSTQSGTTFCGTVTVEPNFAASDYLGRTQASAEAFAASQGLVSRVVRIDDQVFPGTSDYRLDRVNLEIDANKVTKAYLG